MSDHPSQLRIIPFNSSHACNGFDCGDPVVNTTLSQIADNPDGLKSTMLFSAVDDRNIVNGYYSLAATNIEFEEIPENLVEHTGTYPIPAVIIERIGVNKTCQGKGLGTRLLIDALQRIYNATPEIEAMLVLVETGNDRTRAFYLHYGFIPLAGSSSRLFLPMDKVVNLFEETTV